MFRSGFISSDSVRRGGTQHVFTTNLDVPRLPVIPDLGLRLDPQMYSTMFKDTARTTKVTATGDAVASITDLAGLYSGVFFTQGTLAQRPTLAIKNGKTYLQFVGASNQILICQTALGEMTHNRSALELFFVAAVTTGTGVDQWPYWVGTSASGNRVECTMLNASSTQGFTGRRLDAIAAVSVNASLGNSGTTGANAVVSGELAIWSYQFDYAVDTIVLMKNGVPGAWTNAFDTAHTGQSPDSVGVHRLGNGTASNAFTGLMGDVICYQRILTGSERLANLQYLSAKHNITLGF